MKLDEWKSLSDLDSATESERGATESNMQRKAIESILTDRVELSSIETLDFGVSVCL